jgi:integrase
MGLKRVDIIDTADVLAVLSPIWLTKAETARRLRQRLSTVMDWAKAAGFRSGDNPVVGITKGLPRQNGQREHHQAIPYSEIADFLERLKSLDLSGPAKLAYEFLILSACRTNEVLGARWEEVDFGKAIWEIPSSRMKGNRRHTVPLSFRCLEVLNEAQDLAGTSEFVFPGRTGSKPLSNMVFLMTMRRMGISAVPHGFRSTFRDWASEQTNFPNEVCEMALAHAIRDKTEAAYRRGDLLEKRRQLMEAWSRFLANGPVDVQDQVTS